MPAALSSPSSPSTTSNNSQSLTPPAGTTCSLPCPLRTAINLLSDEAFGDGTVRGDGTGSGGGGGGGGGVSSGAALAFSLITLPFESKDGILGGAEGILTKRGGTCAPRYSVSRGEMDKGRRVAIARAAASSRTFCFFFSRSCFFSYSSSFTPSLSQNLASLLSS